jgi:hypothetical protein
MSDEETPKQMRLRRENRAQLDEVLRRVEARGGPASRWEVDLKGRSANLIGGSKVVAFFATEDGRFVLSNFKRADRDADPERESLLEEDAIACIDEAVRQAGPHWHRQG